MEILGLADLEDTVPGAESAPGGVGTADGRAESVDRADRVQCYRGWT